MNINYTYSYTNNFVIINKILIKINYDEWQLKIGHNLKSLIDFIYYNYL